MIKSTFHFPGSRGMFGHILWMLILHLLFWKASPGCKAVAEVETENRGGQFFYGSSLAHAIVNTVNELGAESVVKYSASIVKGTM